MSIASSVDALLVDFGDFVQPGDHARVVVRDLEMQHFAVFQLAVADDVDEPVDVAAGQRGNARPRSLRRTARTSVGRDRLLL